MDWLDLILDRISEFGFENITQLEKQFLHHYDTDEQHYYSLLLKNRDSLYTELYFYDPAKFLTKDPSLLTQRRILDPSDVEDCRLNLIWDNLDIEDGDVFKQIFKIPYFYLDLNWTNLPERHRRNFKEFLHQYYQLG